MARVKIEDKTPPERSGGLYFSTPRDKSEFIPSGSKTLDLALGGGWARRRIANILSDRAVGKCIKNAWIASEYGFQKIDDIGQNFPLGVSPWESVLSLSSGSVSKTSHFWKEVVNQTIKIKTRHGYTLEGTPDHKIMVWSESMQFEMRSLVDMRVGDVAIIAKEFPYQKNELIEISFDYKKSKMSTSEIDIKIPNLVDESLAELIGFYVADGSTAGKKLIFSNNKDWFHKRFFSCLDRSFGIKEQECRKVNSEVSEGTTFWISRIQLFEYFNNIFDKNIKNLTARYKYVPDCIMNSPKKVQAAFLRGLIDCDSWHSKGRFFYNTASEKLAEQVHLLLLNFGVVSFKKSSLGPKPYQDHLYWEIGIQGKYARLYHEVIGYGREKPTFSKTSKSDTDYIPYLPKRLLADIDRTRQIMGWMKNGRTAVGKKLPHFQLNAKNVTFENLEKIIELFSEIEPWFDLSFYRMLASCGYLFDGVVSIESKSETTEVYDVHVPVGHLFWANGFVNHNTLLAIEACANFAMVEPKGKIRYRESESAFDTRYAQALGFPLDRVDFGDPMETVEDVFEDLSKVIEGAKGPEFYIIDSLDALSDRSEMEKDIDKGTYGASKAKLLSQLFRRLVRGLAEKDVTLLIVSQIRENINAGLFAKKYTRSGGKALDFYCSQILYLAQIEKLKKTVKGVTRVTGTRVKAQVEKNKIALPYREAEFQILFGYGINDRAACLDFLKEAKVEVDKNASLDQIHQCVEDAWFEIERGFLVTEKKYKTGE